MGKLTMNKLWNNEQIRTDIYKTTLYSLSYKQIYTNIWHNIKLIYYQYTLIDVTVAKQLINQLYILLK